MVRSTPSPAGGFLLGERGLAVDREQHGEFPAGDPERRQGGRVELGHPQLGVLEQVAQAAGQGRNRRLRRLARGGPAGRAVS